jgi:hypothetical protein
MEYYSRVALPGPDIPCPAPDLHYLNRSEYSLPIYTSILHLILKSTSQNSTMTVCKARMIYV